MTNFVMVGIDNTHTEKLKYICGKDNLVEKSGYKTTYLNLPCRGTHGSGVAIEKNVPVMLILVAGSTQSGESA